MKHPFLWSLILVSLSTIWPVWVGMRTRGPVFIASATMPFLAFVAAWWLAQ